MAKNKSNLSNEKKKKLPFNVLSKKGLMTLAMAGVMIATPFMLAGCSNGQDGKDGAPGTIWKSGTNYTQFVDAKDGDYFIDTDDFILYQKVSGAWSVVMENYGRPGNNGQDGTNGTDGITPTITINNDGYWVINGVPTTTKAQGPAGENGQNGTTPTISINDEGYWVINGEPTDVQAEAINGTNGKDGNTWSVGNEYPTTPNNGDMFLNNTTWEVYQYNGTTWESKGNIKGQDLTIEETLPAYWIEYLDAKIAEINSKAESYGEDSDAFIFITDQHLDGTNDYSSAIINYITERTSIKKVFFGGDILQGGNSDNTLLREYKDSFNSDLLVMGMRGNHDDDGNLTEKAFYDIMVRPLEGNADISNKLYYHYDNEAQKIRYIVLDDYIIDDNQIEWMKSKILELDSEWTVLVFNHEIWEPSKTETTLSFSENGQKVIDAIDSVYGEAECTIAGVYAGHSHRDYLGYSDLGYALITTTINCERNNLTAYDKVTPTRPTGTTKEETLDVVFLNPTTYTFETVRIGSAGSNRTITYTEKQSFDVEDVSLDKNTATTWVDGDEITLTAIITPNKATNKKVTWEIIDGEDLGTITQNGLTCTFTPGSTSGEVVIKVTTEEGSFADTCTITIDAEQPATVNITSEFTTWTAGSIEHSTGIASDSWSDMWVYSNYVDISIYDSITFSHIQTPSQGSSRGYAFYDENKTYISGATHSGLNYVPIERTVDVPSNAKYFRCMWINTAFTEQYDASVHDIETKFYCYGNFNIPQHVQSVSLNKEALSTWVNEETVELKATVNPDNAISNEVVWSIIEGDTLGEITPNGLTCVFTPNSTAGTVRVQVKTVEGEFTATCTITIEETKPAPVNLTSSFTTWTAGSVSYLDGVASDKWNNMWVYSNLVDVSPYTSITFTHIQTTGTTTSLGYAFYDENEEYIWGATNGGISYEPIEKTINVPEGAKYFRTMWILESYENYNAEVHDIDTKFYCYGNYFEAPQTDLTSKFTWTPGSVMSTTGVASEEWSDLWIYSNLVSVGEFKTINFSHVLTESTGTNLGYAFYDATGTYISGGTNRSTDGQYSVFDRTVDVPENAKFFRCMWMNTTHSAYVEETFGLDNFYCYGNQ